MSWFGRKAASVRHAVNSVLMWGSPAPGLTQMRRDVGNGVEASVLMAVIQWLQRAVVEPKFELVSPDGETVVTEHPLLELLATPNKHYTLETLLQSYVYSYVMDGNNYWILVDGAGGPAEIWYAPHYLMEPDYQRDGSDFLSGWKYKPNGQLQYLEIEDVVHFRHGMNPDEPRLGLSPVHSALTEIWADGDAGRLSAYFLKNNGIPGLVLSPKNDGVLEDPEGIKRDIIAKTTGANRGKPLVMMGATEVKEYGFSPQQLDMSAVRDVAEERVTALLGIPAAVVGFGAGLQQTKVGATMTELRKLAWMNGVVPILNCFVGSVNRTLTPRMAEGLLLRANYENVEALQEDRDAISDRTLKQYHGGLINKAEARQKIGQEPDSGDENVWVMPINLLETNGQEPPAQPPPDGGKSGIKKGEEREYAEDHHQSEFERRIADTAPRVQSVPPQLERLVTQMERAESAQQEAFFGPLDFFFNELGRKAEVAALEVLDEKDTLDTERIVEILDLGAEMAALRAIYQRQYLNVAKIVNDTMASTLGLAVDLPDTVAQAVIATGGRRAGLIDLEAQSKRRVFQAISELRSEGAGAADIAREIRSGVARGPWRDSETRSRVIARTETKFAQNASTVARAKAEGMQHMLVFDARLGPTDPICEALDGVIVTVEEAEQLAIDEHPNGTRSFTPIPPSLLEEIQ
ncbi:MAG: phage portal protein [Pseudomonadota bacterium]